MTAPDAEKRIRRIEDRLEIQDLAVRYCIAIDDSDYAGMLPMYTEKAGLGEIGRAAGGRRPAAVHPLDVRPHDSHPAGAHRALRR